MDKLIAELIVKQWLEINWQTKPALKTILGRDEVQTLTTMIEEALKYKDCSCDSALFDVD